MTVKQLKQKLDHLPPNAVLTSRPGRAINVEVEGVDQSRVKLSISTAAAKPFGALINTLHADSRTFAAAFKKAKAFMEGKR